MADHGFALCTSASYDDNRLRICVGNSHLDAEIDEMEMEEDKPWDGTLKALSLKDALFKVDTLHRFHPTAFP